MSSRDLTNQLGEPLELPDTDLENPLPSKNNDLEEILENPSFDESLGPAIESEQLEPETPKYQSKNKRLYFLYSDRDLVIKRYPDGKEKKLIGTFVSGNVLEKVRRRYRECTPEQKHDQSVIGRLIKSAREAQNKSPEKNPEKGHIIYENVNDKNLFILAYTREVKLVS